MKTAGAPPCPTSQLHGPSLSLVIPAYNEAPRIQGTTATAAAWLCQQPYPTELIVVDDGSSDSTAALAEAALAGVPAGYLVRAPHGGKAAAVMVTKRLR